MIYEHAVAPPDADTPDAIRQFTQRCTDVLEMYVRRHPELWLWMHRRWRDRDAHAAAIDHAGLEAQAGSAERLRVPDGGPHDDGTDG